MAKASNKKDYKKDYLLAMSHAPGIDDSASLLHMIPIVLFSAIVILIVRMHIYRRPMTQFFWSGQSDTTDISDFFSYDKMVLVCVAAGIALLMLLFRVTTQSLTIKRSYAYIPMGIYSIFVIISYAFSNYKEFALWGWNDRFEGTIPILCYMIMLFLVINSVNTEQNIKQIIIPIAISAALLSLLGLSQALDHDFFRTVAGQKLLVPNVALENGGTTWQQIEAAAANGKQYLIFTFQHQEIYQTVYNINYVSFYLTLLVPLFIMLFVRAVREEKINLKKVIALGVLIALLIYNLIGSQSSGGYLGIFVAFIVAIILFNKQILKWIKPFIIVIVIIAAVLVATVGRWMPEVSGAVASVLGKQTALQVETQNQEAEEAKAKSSQKVLAPTIEYITTEGKTVTMSINGEELVIDVDTNADVIEGISVSDKDGKTLNLISVNETSSYEIDDDRFRDVAKLTLAYSGNTYFVQIETTGAYWNFVPQNDEMYFMPITGKPIKLSKIPTIGFENNKGFGSGRGSIWSHSFPLLKDSLVIGTGADTYCAVYPQNDYAAKWTENYAGKWIADDEEFNNLYLIVDKPHNMYLHAGIGTGCVSLVALLALYGIYLVQSFKLFWKRDLQNDFILFTGAGTFLGVTGFLVSGLVDDSTVSVMPLFYTMLGMGIAINLIIKRRDEQNAAK